MKLNSRLHSILSNCEDLDLHSSHGLMVQQELIRLCTQYLKIIENDKAIQNFLPSMRDIFNDILRLDGNIPLRERIKLLDIHSKLIEMPIGYAKMHIPKYQIQHDNALVELPYEVITFSAYRRLQELGYNLFDYKNFSTISFLGLKEYIYFGIIEIHEISVFKEKLR
jgi:hypothetical protein